MTLSRNGSNRWMAKLAAILFAVQTVLVAFSTGTAASPVTRDQFGNILCLASTHEAPSDSSRPAGKAHGDGLECCRLFCSMAGDRLLPPTPVALGAPDRGAGIALAAPKRQSAAPVSRSGEKKARAPPAES